MNTPNNNRATVLGVLSGDYDDGKTAREVADAAGLKYSTVTGVLRDLATDGLASSYRSGRQVTWTRCDAAADDRDGTDTDGHEFPTADFEANGVHVLDPAETDAASTGARVVAEVQDVAGPVPVRIDDNPSVAAVDASDALVGTTTPADPRSAVSGDLTAAHSAADVLGFMTGVRPLPDAPAVPEKKARTPRAPRTPSAGAREVRNDFGNGGLQGEILRYMDANRAADGTYQVFAVGELAKALSAHSSSVAYSLKRTTTKGQTVDVTVTAGHPRFRLATSDETAAYYRARADKAVETAATASAA